MAWNAIFPTPATRISQSVQQIQDNWAFLQANINTDHYFNSGAPNEGHHRFVQLVDQGADPVVAVSSVFYSKLGPGGASQPYFRNGTDVRAVTTYINGNFVLAGPGVYLLDLSTYPPFVGYFSIYRQGGSAGNGCAFVVWDTFNARVSQITVRGSIVSIGEATTNIAINTTSGAGVTLQWQLINMQNVT